MISKKIVIRMRNGLEARPTALLVQIACKYASSIYITMDEKRANAKSIMGMMSLSPVSGDVITVEAEGADAQAAIEEIEQYLCEK